MAFKFDKQVAEPSVETEAVKSGLDYNAAVSHDRAAVEQIQSNRVDRRLDVVEMHAMTEASIAKAHEQMHSILAKFDRLPASVKEALFAETPEHMWSDRENHPAHAILADAYHASIARSAMC